MRVSTIGKLTVLASVIMMIWSAVGFWEFMKATPDSPQLTPMMEFAAGHLFVPSVFVFVVGAVIWLAGKSNPKLSVSEALGGANRRWSLSRVIEQRDEATRTKE